MKNLVIVIIGFLALTHTCEARHSDPVRRRLPEERRIVFRPDFAPFKQKSHRYPPIYHCHRHPFRRVCYHRHCK